MSKKKTKATPDTIVLGISGEAVLVLGLILALKNEPSWVPVVSIALAAAGLFLTVWGCTSATGIWWRIAACVFAIR